MCIGFRMPRGIKSLGSEIEQNRCFFRFYVIILKTILILSAITKKYCIFALSYFYIFYS